MKLVAIDGNSLINRAYYGVRLLTNSEGVCTNAVYGFFNMLLKLQADLTPDAVCVCFDLSGKTFRHEAFEEYKAGRRPMPEELAMQFPLIKEALDAMGIARREVAGYEADDLLGTLARISRERGDECVIVTGDRDSLQFIAEGATVALVTTKMGQTQTEMYDAALFAERYNGLTPDKIVDLKAIMGDQSDHIPGVPGIGEKGALTLVSRFGSLEGVYANLDDKSITDAMRRKLVDGRDSAFLSYSLAKGEVHAPIEDDAHTLLPAPRRDGTLYALFSRLELNTLIKRLELRPESDAPQAASFAPPAATLSEPPANVFDGGMLGCTVNSAATACALCAPGGCYAFSEEMLGSAKFADVMRRAAQAPLCVYDGKRALHALSRLGIEPFTPAGDISIEAYLCDPSATGAEFAKTAHDVLGVTIADEALYESDDAFSPLTGADDAALRALAHNAAVTRALHQTLLPRIAERGMEVLLRDIELPLVPVLVRMELYGMGIDRARLTEFGETLRRDIAHLEERIHTLAGEAFNIGSPKQLGVILFEKLGLKAAKKTKTGYSTDVEVLEKLRDEHPIVAAVLDWRAMTKLRGTYVEGLLKEIASDGRIHSTLRQTVAATGRLSSTEPNLQNIPVRTALGGEIRRCFVPRNGWVYIDADYSQIELRILAHIAHDERMLAAFASGEDIHAVTASQVFRVPLAEVTHELRRRAKAVNFGIVYGISAFSLSDDVGVSVKEAQHYIDAYLENYTGVRGYMERIRAQAKDDGYVATLYGRRRYLPELRSSSHNIRAFGERVALNTPIQGTAADVIKLAMLHVDARLRGEGLRARLIMQVHDELLVEAPAEERERVSALLVEEMEHAAALDVRLAADVSFGDNWYDAKR